MLKQLTILSFIVMTACSASEQAIDSGPMPDSEPMTLVPADECVSGFASGKLGFENQEFVLDLPQPIGGLFEARVDQDRGLVAELYLQKWMAPGIWVFVADGAGTNTVSFYGNLGTYRWVATWVSGLGMASICATSPDTTLTNGQ